MPGAKPTLHFPHIVWLSLLSSALLYLVTSLQVVSDITQFMPDNHANKNIQLLTDELKNGNTSRLLILSLSGSNPEKLASLSQELKKKLSIKPGYSMVKNGAQSFSADDFLNGHYKLLYKYRYLLSPNTSLSKAELENSLKQRLTELRSGITFFKDTLASDPQNHFLQHLTQLSERVGTSRYHGVWFDKSKSAALLMVELNLNQFSLDQQELLIDEIKTIAHTLSGKHGIEDRLQLDITGAPSIAVKTRSAIKSTTQWLSSIALALLFILFWWSYRSYRLFFIAVLPLGSAIIIALAITNLLFGQVHGIIIAFGITLLGVCLDYPVHLFSHQQLAHKAHQVIKSIWPTLRLGVITTALAYLAMLGTGFSGLSQLAIFAISGLFTALLVTRWIIPALLDEKTNIPDRNYIKFFRNKSLRSNNRRVIILVLFIFCSGVTAYHHKTALSDDISALSPVPQDVKDIDKKLRQAVAAPDINHIFILKNQNSELLLQQTEALKHKLTPLQKNGLVKNIFSISDFIPSKKTQAFNQSLLPDPQLVLTNMASAAASLPFKESLFTPFIHDITISKNLKPLDIELLLGSPAARHIQQDFFFRNNSWVSVIRLGGVSNEQALYSWISSKQDIKPAYLNLRHATSELMSGYQQTALQRLLLGTIIITLLLLVFRPVSRAVAILTPVFLAVFLSITLQLLAGTSLTLFHILALLLIIGIGLDYSLFYDRDWTSEDDYSRRIHGIFISATSTLITFGILGFSDIPVLAALGQTVAIGVLGCFILTLLFNINYPRKTE